MAFRHEVQDYEEAVSYYHDHVYQARMARAEGLLNLMERNIVARYTFEAGLIMRARLKLHEWIDPKNFIHVLFSVAERGGSDWVKEHIQTAKLCRQEIQAARQEMRMIREGGLVAAMKLIEKQQE